MGRLLIQFPGSTNAKVSNETLPKNTIVIDEENKQLRLHDGVTRGGFPIGDRGGEAPATTDLDNLTMTGRNIGNWSTNVSNCVAETPQDIKLELSNGTLTLKAGSVVYVPNGPGVFDRVDIDADVQISATSGTAKCMICVSENGLSSATSTVNNCVSGAGATPVDYGMCYDTTTNIIQRWGGGTISIAKASFPLAIVTLTDGVFTSIDQVFNGFGYIGSTLFKMIDNKVVASNGRNEDGTLKNTIVRTSSVEILTMPSYMAGRGNCPLFITNTGVMYATGINNNSYFEVDKFIDADMSISYSAWFVREDNRWYATTTGGAYVKKTWGRVGSIGVDSDLRITRLDIELPFRAINTSDVKVIINTTFKKVSALPSSPDPDTWYAIPE